MNKVKINIKFFACMKDIVGEREQTLTLPKDSNINFVLEELKSKYPLITEKMINSSFVAINESYALKHNLLKEGDILAIIPPAFNV